MKVNWILFCLSGAILAAYIYLANDLMFQAAGREALLDERARLILDLGALETRYLALAEKITIEEAYALGFEEAGTNLSFTATWPVHLALGYGR